MGSPFPGMDPYLEQHWGDVHASLIIDGRDQLQQRLPPVAESPGPTFESVVGVHRQGIG
jgi:hypothetical protein